MEFKSGPIKLSVGAKPRDAEADRATLKAIDARLQAGEVEEAARDGMSVSEQLAAIATRVHELVAIQSQSLSVLMPKLAEARAIANANPTAGADAFADSVAPAIREARAAGAKTLREIAAALNGRGIATARGGKWAPQAVANVLRWIG